MAKVEYLFRFGFFMACLVIAWLSLTPTTLAPDVQGGDKIAHFLAYGALTSLGVFAFRAKRHLLWLALGLTVMGIMVEVIQPYVGRVMAFDDFLANTLGVLAALAPARFVLRHWQRIMPGW